VCPPAGGDESRSELALAGTAKPILVRVHERARKTYAGGHSKARFQRTPPRRETDPCSRYDAERLTSGGRVACIPRLTVGVQVRDNARASPTMAVVRGG